MINKKVTTIIVTFNGMKWLERCLESLAASDVLTEIIIVDNGSKDGTIELIKFNFPKATLIESKVNLGFGAANNLGVHIAMERGADFVFLLNQDTRVESNTIGKLIESLEGHDDIAIVSPIHLNGKGNAMDWGFESCLNNHACKGYMSDLVLGKLRPQYEIAMVNAAAWLLKTSVIAKIGLFSKAFFHYAEDSNFTHRLNFFGYKVVINPHCFIYHDRDERRGKKTSLGLQFDHENKTKIIMLNINDSYKRCYIKLLRYSGLLILQGFVLKGIGLAFDPLMKYSYYRTLRENYLVKDKFIVDKEFY